MKILALSIVLLSALSLFSQESFKVIKISGTITNENSKSNLQRGSVFNDNDKLMFGSSTSRAAVINSSGRYILASNNKNDMYAKSFLAPAMSNMSSRSGAIVNIVDLKNHFSGNYLIFKTSKIKISKDNFPMNEDNFFFIKYEYKGEPINKQLEFYSDTLIIDQKELMTVDGMPIPNPEIKKMELFYYKKAENNVVSIGAFSPIFLNDDEFKSEVEIILDSVTKETKEEKINEVLSYVNDFYGKPNKENLIDWIEANFQL